MPVLPTKDERRVPLESSGLSLQRRRIGGIAEIICRCSTIAKIAKKMKWKRRLPIGAVLLDSREEFCLMLMKTTILLSTSLKQRSHVRRGVWGATIHAFLRGGRARGGSLFLEIGVPHSIEVVKRSTLMNLRVR